MRAIVTIALALAAAPAQAGSAFVVNLTSGDLEIYDTVTQVRTVVGPLFVPLSQGDLAWDPNIARLYLIEGNTLFRVDTGTGFPTPIGNHFVPNMSGLVVDPVLGRLFATSTGPTGFWRMDTSTGEAVLVGDPGIALDSIAYDPGSGSLVGREEGTGDVYSVDRSDGSTGLLASGVGAPTAHAWDFDPDTGTFVTVADDGLWRSNDPGAGYAEVDSGALTEPTNGMTLFGPSAPFSLTITGTCNGPGTVDISGITANGPFAVARGPDLAGAVVPAGTCTGTAIDLGSPSLIKVLNADASGTFSAAPDIPPTVCGGFIQAVDLTNCRISNVQGPF